MTWPASDRYKSPNTQRSDVRGNIPTGAPPNAAIVLKAYYDKVTP